MGALALKMKDLDEDDFSPEIAAATKECSGCDPDVPGHENRATCSVCKGTGREKLSFAAAFAEIIASKQEETCKSQGRGGGDYDYEDEDDTPSDLEY